MLIRLLLLKIKCVHDVKMRARGNFTVVISSLIEQDISTLLATVISSTVFCVLRKCVLPWATGINMKKKKKKKSVKNSYMHLSIPNIHYIITCFVPNNF